MARKRDHDFIIALVREISGSLRKAVPWGAACFMAWCIVLIFRELAGRMTVAQVDGFIGFFYKDELAGVSFDPTRTSSLLETDGSTREEDRL
jgi:hypothetical protein